jgi:hypothetical protein
MTLHRVMLEPSAKTWEQVAQEIDEGRHSDSTVPKVGHKPSLARELIMLTNGRTD